MGIGRKPRGVAMPVRADDRGVLYLRKDFPRDATRRRVRWKKPVWVENGQGASPLQIDRLRSIGSEIWLPIRSE